MIIWPACTLAVHGLLGHILFLIGQPMPAWVLVLAAMTAAGVVSRMPAIAESAPTPSPSRPILIASAVVIVGLFSWSAWTSYITPDRSWDGLVSWSLRVEALGSPADLTRPFFSQPEVFAHSRSYPLLQPLVLSSLGDLLGAQSARLFFPCLYLLLFLILVGTCRRLGVTWGWTMLLSLGLAWTPGYMDVGAAAIDSGYGDLFLAYAVALGAVGLLFEDAPLLFLACLLLPWIKPEGMIYAAILGGILALGDRRRSVAWAAMGLGLSLALWIPLRARLTFSSETWLFLIGPGMTLLLFASHRLFQLHRSARSRMWILGSLVILCVALGAAGSPWLAQSSDPLLRDFVSNLVDLVDRLASLPAMLLGFGAALLAIKTVGLVFLILVPAVLLLRGRETVGGRQVRYFLFLSLIFLFVAILLSPERDLEHELKSRLARLILHIVPATWILLAQVPSLWCLPPVEGEVVESKNGPTSAPEARP